MPLRLAIVGCGDVARQYLTSRSPGDDGIDVVAACDLDEARARRLADAFAIPQVLGGSGELVATGIADAALNATPSPVHADVVEELVRGGLHVLCEKPLASSAERGRQLAELAGAHDRVLLVAPSITVLPLWATVRNLVAEGAIGRAHSASARFHGSPWPWPGFSGDPRWYFRAEVGPLRDVGIYALAMLRDLFGPVRSVTCTAEALIRERRVVDGPAAGTTFASEGEDFFAVGLSFEGGGMASVEASFDVHATRAPQVEIYGDAGSIAFAPFGDPDVVHLFRETTGDWEELRVQDGAPSRAEVPLDYWAGVMELAEVVASGRPSALAADRACELLDVIDAAYGAARASRTEAVCSG